uniref:hypothetical protein n=1 Tax=Streptococcus pluranimalium TaxID=82348 RepID=UPI003F692129
MKKNMMNKHYWTYKTLFQPTAQDIRLAILGYFTGTLWACEVDVVEVNGIGYGVFVTYDSYFDKSDRLMKIARAVESDGLD